MTISTRLLAALDRVAPASRVAAHCDGPCGVYDPASARIAAEAVLSMTKKLVDLGDGGDLATENTRSRFIAIKEQEAAEELMNQIKTVHEIFWATKGRDIPWYTAS